jgi:hypothetical protein
VLIVVVITEPPVGVPARACRVVAIPRIVPEIERGGVANTTGVYLRSAGLPGTVLPAALGIGTYRVSSSRHDRTYASVGCQLAPGDDLMTVLDRLERDLSAARRKVLSA